MMICFPLLISCAVLSKTQQEAINHLAVMGGEVSKSPSMIMDYIAQSRLDRGLIYVSSIQTEELHTLELESLFKAHENDVKLARKFDAGVEFLNSYLYALRSVANDNRWDDYGTEIRSLGRTLNVTLKELNKIGWVDEKLPNDLVKNSIDGVAGVTESIVRRRQMMVLRNLITQGDTLVNIAVDSMVVILKSEHLDEILKNEEQGLRDNYTAFLRALPENQVSLEWDHMYVDIKQKIQFSKQMRRSCITSLQAFKRAHNRVAKDVLKRKDLKEVYGEFIDLAEQSAKLSQLIQKEIKRQDKQ